MGCIITCGVGCDDPWDDGGRLKLRRLLVEAGVDKSDFLLTADGVLSFRGKSKDDLVAEPMDSLLAGFRNCEDMLLLLIWICGFDGGEKTRSQLSERRSAASVASVASTL